MARAILPRSGREAFIRAAALVAGAVTAGEGPLVCGSVLSSLVAVAFALRAGGTEPRRSLPGPAPWRAILTFIAPWFLVGFLSAALQDTFDPARSLLKTWAAQGIQAEVTPVSLRARLLDLQAIPDGRLALALRIERYRIPGKEPFEETVSPPTEARLTVPIDDGDPPCWKPGDRLDLTSRIGPPHNFRNPGGFDYKSSLAARGIGLTGTIKSPRLVEVVAGDRQAWRDILPSARRSVVEALSRAAGADHQETASFLAALLIGERDDLPPALTQALVRAGVYHIVALSGLNVAVITFLTALVLHLIPLPAAIRRWSLVLGVLLYWLLARGGGSITRAAVMALLYLGGALLERRVSALGALSVAAGLLLLRRFRWAWDAGFQLTFAASLALIVLGPTRTPGSDGEKSRFAALASRVLASLRVSGAALAGTAMITARHFQTMAPAALIANLLAVPAANLLLVLAVGIVLLWIPAPACAAALSDLASLIVRGLTDFAAAVSSPWWLSFHVVPPPGWLVIGSGAALILAGGLPPGAGRRLAWIGLLAAILRTACVGRGAPAGGCLEVTALDVGQGDAILVRLPTGPTLLVDAGGFARSTFDVGERVVAPALRALGHLRIDILAVTHAHRDHLGGAAAIVRELSPRALWLGRMPQGDPNVASLEKMADERGIPVVLPRRGVRLSIGGATIEILNPGEGAPNRGGARNDDSLVLRITAGRRSVLMTGDMEAPLESVLLAERRRIQADLLKVGHHGSSTSTTERFLVQVDPHLAIISVGEWNPWGHPDSLVLHRLAAAGVDVYRTDRNGAFRFRTDGQRPWTVESLAPPEFNKDIPATESAPE